MARAKASFVIDRWEEHPALDEEGAKLTRTAIGKTFSGDIVGATVGEMVMAGGSGGWRAYVGFDRFSVAVHGRSGGFVLLHDAWGDASGNGSASWTVIPSSGTGELAGLTGRATIQRHEDGSHTFELEYELG